MAIIEIKQEVTLNTGNFNNYKPLVGIQIDTDKDIDVELELAIAAIKKAFTVVEDEVERQIGVTDLKNNESLSINNAKNIGILNDFVDGLEERVIGLEKR